METKIIAEIGINHNGVLDFALELIKHSAAAGCDYVKFQKRNPDVCVPDSQKNLIRSTPYGDVTYLDYKKQLEFNEEQYDKIDSYCKELNIKWFASVWDKDSVDFMTRYTDIMKIPSALITDLELCMYAREKSKTLMISTGMSTEQQIFNCISACSPNIVFHTNSAYPSPISELNLKYIKRLKDAHPDVSVGYSGHEYGLTTTFAAVALGAEWIERHITLDRTMWGSDHLASIEPIGLYKLVKGIRDIDIAIGCDCPRIITPSEFKKLNSLRK